MLNVFMLIFGLIVIVEMHVLSLESQDFERAPLAAGSSKGKQADRRAAGENAH